MLPKDLWKPWEPRVLFPVFSNCENAFDFCVQETLRPTSFKELARPGYYAWKKQKDWSSTWRSYRDVLLGSKIRFRGGLLNRDGELLDSWNFEGTYGVGETFHVNLNKFMESRGLNVSDGEFLLVASRGRPDRWNSSPGNVTARYVGAEFIGGYRTGFFARKLNASDKGHFGYTGLNPKVLLRDGLEASLMLMNHSSEPEYSRSCRPIVRLYRSASEFLEADFAEIPPHGIRERRLTELFPNANEFLAPTEGRGFTISKVKGVSLASIHLLRGKDGTTFGMEHSRPAHPNVIQYAVQKPVKGKPR